MPPGRSSGGYAPVQLTEEEAAALAAEQAAAYGSDYAPVEPPPADPVQPPPAQTYQPAAPDNYVPGSTYVPPAQESAPPPSTAVASEPYAPAEPEPYTSISPQVTSTANPRTDPAWHAPASEMRDSAASVYRAYEPDPAPLPTTTPSSPAFNTTMSVVQKNQPDATPAYLQDVAGYIRGRGNAGVAPSGETRIAAPPQTGPFGWTLDALSPLGALKDGIQGNDTYVPKDPPGMPRPSIAGGLSSLYPGEVPPTKTTSDPVGNDAAGESAGDLFARSLGLNPDDPTDNLYQQFVNAFYRQGGDVLGRATRWTAERTGDVLADQARFYGDRAKETLGLAAGLALDQAMFHGDATRRLGETGKAVAENLWRGGEAVVGPHGTGLRQAQSTFNPVGAAIAENLVDPLGAAKDDFFGFAIDDLGLDAKSDDLADFFNRGAERVQGLTEGRDSLGTALWDLGNMPLPSFGQPTPQPQEFDLNHPEASWLLNLRGLAAQAGSEAGLALRQAVDQEGTRQAQRARGAALGARLNGGSPLNAALAASGTLAQDALKALPVSPVDASDVRNMLYIPRSPLTQTGVAEPGARDRDAQATGTTGAVRTSGARQEDEGSWWDRARDTAAGILPSEDEPAPVRYDPLSSAYVPRSPDSAQADPALMQRAREAATAAKNWAAGLDMPDVSLPSFSLPFREYLPAEPTLGEGAPLNIRRASPQPTVEEGAPLTVRRTGPEGIDPNALDVPIPYDPLSSAYVPREPAAVQADPAVLQQAREAANAAKAWASGLSMPNIALPDVNLPLRGDGASVGNGQAPLTLRRGDPSAAYTPESPEFVVRRTPMEPEAPEPTLLDQVRGAGSDVVQGIADRLTLPASLPDVNLPDVNLPDVTLPKITLPGRDASAAGGPGTGGQSAGVAAAAAPAPQTGATRTATLPSGMVTAEQKGVLWVKGPNGEDDYRGLVDPVTGEYVLWPAGATNAQVDGIVDEVLAAAKANPAPGPATTTRNTQASATGNAGTTPTRSNGQGSGSGSTIPTSGNAGSATTSRTSTRRSTPASLDDAADTAPLKLEDFIQDFDGDGTISKRDRAMGKQAFEQAKAARSKRRRGKTTSRKGNAQFPFNRPDSAIRQTVLNAIAESQGRG